MMPVIQGIHLEGPFISAVFKGAQPEEHIELPDASLMRRWQELSGGLIRLVTYAPETSDATAFEKYCLDNRIVAFGRPLKCTSKPIATIQSNAHHPSLQCAKGHSIIVSPV